MTRHPGIHGDGACAPSWRWGAEWIPAYAGMTERDAPRPQYPLPPRSRRPLPLLGRVESRRLRASNGGEIPRLRGNDEAPGGYMETGLAPRRGAGAPNGFLPTQE